MNHRETEFSGEEENGPTADSVSGSSNLGLSITNWTSNLIATAIVLVIVFAFGSQLVSFWFPPVRKQPVFELAQSWPALQACTLEFGDAPIQLKRQSFTGCKPEVFTFLQNECKKVLNQNADPIGSVTRQESAMIAESNSIDPAESVEHKWRIYFGAQLARQSPLPTVFGIRDNCQSDQSGDTVTRDTCSRLVVWGIALPGESAEDWTTFVGTAATLERSLDLENALIPAGSKRTLAISDDQGGILIGFQGGELQSAITFYKDLAVSRGWETEQTWRQTGDSWHALYLPDSESAISGIQVQLNGNHTENLSGVLMLQSNQQRTQTNFEGETLNE